MMQMRNAAERRAIPLPINAGVYLRDAIRDRFVLFQASWPVQKGLRLVKLLKPSHVIIHAIDPNDSYYLYTGQEAIEHLVAAPNKTPVHEAFQLNQSPSTPVLDGYGSLETAPARVVVVEEGQIIGFRDAMFESSQRDHRTRGSGAASTKPVKCSLVADFPDQVCLGATHSLLISLSLEIIDQAKAMPLILPAGSKVDVVIQPQRGFALEGTGEGTLTVKETDDAPPLQFKLKATQQGAGRIRILAFHLGQPLGVITLAPVVSAAAETSSTRRHSRKQTIELIRANAPDLTLLILEDKSKLKPSFTFKLTAPDASLGLNYKTFGSITLESDPLRIFTDSFKEIEEMPIKTANDRANAQIRLDAKGAHLFETVVPHELQVLLWDLWNKQRQKKLTLSVQVQSEEPWIPWELCKLQGMENGRLVKGPFLCEAFAVTRWLLEIPQIPDLTFKNIALVVPADSALELAPTESEYLLSLNGSKRRVKKIKAAFPELRKAFEDEKYDGWHFTGHGGFQSPDPNRSAITLESGDKMIPEDLSGIQLPRPLVFLNACQVGRSAMSLTGIGGWANKFLRAGAGAFIGAYWSIYDDAALDFARAFYDLLLSGMTVGRAVQKARVKIKPAGDPTWLAYTVFAHPLARLV